VPIHAIDESFKIVAVYISFIYFMFDFRLGYSTAADVIELKGRVACEISR
jgi:superfamily II RNA helicase